MTWKEKTKSKPRSPCAVFVQWVHVRSGLRKAAGQVIIKKRKFVTENLLGNGSVRGLLLAHSDPAPLEAFMVLHVQTHQKALLVLQDLWLHLTRRCSRLGFISMVAMLQSVHVTVCFHRSCLCMTGYEAPVLEVSVLPSKVSVKFSPSIQSELLPLWMLIHSLFLEKSMFHLSVSKLKFFIFLCFAKCFTQGIKKKAALRMQRTRAVW